VLSEKGGIFKTLPELPGINKRQLRFSCIHALKIEMQMICDSFSLVFWPLRGEVTAYFNVLLALFGWIVLNAWVSCR